MNPSQRFRAPLILGHRGASAIAPENTLAAFTRAIHDGADGIEFDVRLARDGVPVVIHDASLTRTATLSQLVRELSAAELQTIDVGSWFDKARRTSGKIYANERLPTLAQVFELFGSQKAALYVEMKCDPDEGPGLASAVAELINSRGMHDCVVVESFDLNAIRAIKGSDRRIRTAALFEPKLSKPVASISRSRIVKLARSHEADEIALHHSLARGGLLKEARTEGFEVVVWTVDDAEWVERARKAGVKALIANDPGALVRFRDGNPPFPS